MTSLSQNGPLIIFCVVCFIWLVGYYYIRKFDISSDKKFDLSVRNIAALSVFLVTYNIYVSVRSNDRIEKSRISYNTLANIQQNWLQPQRELCQSYPEGYFLYKSMTPDAEFGTIEPTHFDTAKRRQLEVYSSMRIFQAMEDFLSTGSYDITGSYVWVNNFLMWMQSPILRQNWQKLSFNYSQDTRELVARIINKSDELITLRKTKGKLTSHDYDTLSKAFSIKFR
ncbi:hypothetical protein [Foetidibacter luteolus]|uniref:hypothetical protein n=1 Tax=Foetidibacter luteolus TaxID=2608880 RepID=UPI00129AB99B|nr:hypothetical protein [Foetidibacter luteolus]